LEEGISEVEQQANTLPATPLSKALPRTGGFASSPLGEFAFHLMNLSSAATQINRRVSATSARRPSAWVLC